MPRMLTLDDIKPTPSSIRIDRTGYKLEDMTILGFSDRRDGRIYWVAQCICGRIWEVRAANLTRTPRCRFCAKLGPTRVWKHGKCGTRVYSLWCALKKNGSRLCTEWETFEGFYADVGDPPVGKCHFYIPPTGPINKDTAEFLKGHQKNRNITAFGETHSMTEWALMRGLSAERIRQRVEEALAGDQSMEHALRPAVSRVEIEELLAERWERLNQERMKVFESYLDGEVHAFRAEDPRYIIRVLQRLAGGRKIHSRVIDHLVLFKAESCDKVR